MSSGRWAAPLRESNPTHELRKMVLKMRKLAGGGGKMVRAVAAFVGEGRSDGIDVYISHWGIQVGNHMWELHTNGKNKSLAIQRLSGRDIWQSDVGETSVGWTRLSDTEIDKAGMWSPSVDA